MCRKFLVGRGIPLVSDQLWCCAPGGCHPGLPGIPLGKKKLEAAGNGPKTAAGLVTAAGYIMLFLLTTAFLVNDTYNPFLYFRF